MGFLTGVIIGVAVFIGVNGHQSTIAHEKAMKAQFAAELEQKNVALAKARQPKKQMTAKLNGVEVMNLSGETHA